MGTEALCRLLEEPDATAALNEPTAGIPICRAWILVLRGLPSDQTAYLDADTQSAHNFRRRILECIESKDVPFRHLTLPREWKLSHSLYALALADFRAVNELLTFLSLHYSRLSQISGLGRAWAIV